MIPPLPRDLPHIIAEGVSTSVATAVAAVAPVDGIAPGAARRTAIATALATPRKGAKQLLATSDAARAQTRSDARSSSRIDRIVTKALGVTADYVNAMRAELPRFAQPGSEDFAGMKAVGVTPEFARGLVAAGFRNIDAEELTEARAVGVSGDYVRASRAPACRSTSTIMFSSERSACSRNSSRACAGPAIPSAIPTNS